jgi:hypothetical protein
MTDLELWCIGIVTSKPLQVRNSGLWIVPVHAQYSALWTTCTPQMFHEVNQKHNFVSSKLFLLYPCSSQKRKVNSLFEPHIFSY